MQDGAWSSLRNSLVLYSFDWFGGPDFNTKFWIKWIDTFSSMFRYLIRDSASVSRMKSRNAANCLFI